MTAFIGIRECGAERVSRFASPRAIVVETLLAAALPGLRPRERRAIRLASLLAEVTGTALKRLFPRKRPTKTRLGPCGDQSFPSTHAAHAAALAFAAARVAQRHGAGAWGYLVAAGLTGLVMVERVRAAAHWPTDVLAGAALGASCAASACAIAKA